MLRLGALEGRRAATRLQDADVRTARRSTLELQEMRLGNIITSYGNRPIGSAFA